MQIRPQPNIEVLSEPDHLTKKSRINHAANINCLNKQLEPDSDSSTEIKEQKQNGLLVPTADAQQEEEKKEASA
jgi:hypothetical protein